MDFPVKPMRDAVLERIYHLMKSDSDIFVVSADFGSPVLDRIRSEFPERFINVGIAEQNLINVCAGLALEGFKVFAYAIAPFITMRCYEQIRVNLALLSQLREMNVTLIGVGAGYSYVVSGPTHQCYEDITIMRALPNMRVYSPSDWYQAQSLVDHCLKGNGISYLRLDAQVVKQLYDQHSNLDYDQGFYYEQNGDHLCIVSTGYLTQTAYKLTELFQHKEVSQPSLVDIINLSDLNTSALAGVLQSYRHIVSLEEAFIGKGGLDSLMRKLIDDYSLNCRFYPKGIDPHYEFALGDRQCHHERSGIGIDSLSQFVSRLMSEK